LGFMGRAGRQPIVFSTVPLAPSRVTGMMPGNGDFEAIAARRFLRRGTSVGRRIETTAYGATSTFLPRITRTLDLARRLM